MYNSDANTLQREWCVSYYLCRHGYRGSICPPCPLSQVSAILLNCPKF